MRKVKTIWKLTAALLASLMLVFVVLPHHHHHDSTHSICFSVHGDQDHLHTHGHSSSPCPESEAPCEGCPMEFDQIIVEASGHSHTSKCSVSDCHCDNHLKLVKLVPDFLAWIAGHSETILPCPTGSAFSHRTLAIDRVHAAILLGLGLRAPPVA